MTSIVNPRWKQLLVGTMLKLPKLRDLRVFAVSLLALVCVACNSQTITNVRTMLNDNNITVYSSIPSDIVGIYLADFETKHPEVNVNLVNEVTLDLIERLLSEQNDPQADVIWGLAVSSMLTLEWNYLLTMYAPEGLERIDPIFLDDEETPQWVGISARSITLCVNEEELEKRNLPLPTSWQDLINPIYRGQLLILNPGQTSVGYLLLSTILQRYGDVDGWDYMDQLHENVEGAYANNARGVCQWILRGDYPIGLTYDYRAYFPNESEMLLVFPIEGVGWDMEVNGLVRKEYIKTGAKTFLDWAISDSAMQLYAQDRLILAAATDSDSVQLVDGVEISSHLLDLDIAWVAANRKRIQGEWMDLYGDELELINTSQ